ncbi:hypothetical protein Shyhy01_35170 [Streptomyces hygroscopicus subsp. hygroscopicus]|nr:hypothetical protein Shyhy01_35170 [Streptomyces hygroscopicus subsp. hygroscopicus]
MAGRYTPSFFAAVAGFIVWVLCCDFMETRVSAVRAGADHEPGPRAGIVAGDRGRGRGR